MDFKALQTSERIAHDAGVDVATVQAAAITGRIEPDFIASRALYSAEGVARIKAHLQESPVETTDHQPPHQDHWPAAFIARLAASGVTINAFENWNADLQAGVIDSWNAEQEQLAEQEEAGDGDE